MERRLQLADLELTVRRHSGFNRNLEGGKSGRQGPLNKTKDAITEYGFEGSTFDGDLHVLFARYYERNNNHEKAVEYGEKAIEIYNNRTDGYYSQYAYFIHIFKGNSHFALGQKDDDIDEKIKAALEYQVVMQNLEGALPADHPFVKTAFTSWMKTRSVIEDSGKLEEAEAAGLCECWPFENYKNKPIPLKRTPPRFPNRAKQSGKVWLNFDLDEQGVPYDIQVIDSTARVIETAAKKSVENWRYSKADSDVDPKTRQDIPVRILFRLLDSGGNIVPE